MSVSTKFQAHRIITSDEINRQHGIQKFAEVVLGKPSDKCKNFGICRINAIKPELIFRLKQDLLKCGCKKVYALASLIPYAYFELAFLRTTVTPVVFEQHFRNKIFTVEEDYTLDKEFMGIPITIKIGQYTIGISDRFYVTRFDLK